MKYKNLTQLFFQQAELHPSEICCYADTATRRSEYKPQAWLWSVLAERVRLVAAALQEQGIAAGDKVGLFAETRAEWMLVDLAIISLGAVTVTIYPSSSVAELAFIIEDADLKAIFVEDKKLLSVLYEAGARTLNIFSIEEQEAVTSLGQLEEMGAMVEKALGRFQPAGLLAEGSDLVSIVYTSGTSGEPKGVLVTQNNLLSSLESIGHFLPVKEPDEGLLACLTSAHIFQRVAGQWYFLSVCRPIHFCSIEKLALGMKESKATVLLAVPLILERLRRKILQGIQELPEHRRKILEEALHCSLKLCNLRFETKNPFLRGFLFTTTSAVQKALLASLRDKFAPHLKLIVSGGAPLPTDLFLFFESLGLPVREGYGLTETMGPIVCNTLTKPKVGSAGQPMKGVSLRLTGEGEISFRGPMIFTGYQNKTEASRASFDAEGWFLTGDLGSIDEEGYLFITGRKKELIVTAGGKKISPSFVEEKLIRSPYLEHVLVFGEGQRWLVALVTLVHEKVVESFPEAGSSWEDFVTSSDIRDLVWAEIESLQAELPEYERVKRFLVLPQAFSKDKEELTHTLKLKRKVILKNYEKQVQGLFA